MSLAARDPLMDTFFRSTAPVSRPEPAAVAPRIEQAPVAEPAPIVKPVLAAAAPSPAVAPVISAAPVRTAGTRSRAGNAMGRSRTALLDGARRAVETSGTRITMAQVAAGAGVAKATLYNHFRTREDVLAALVQDEVAALVSRFADVPLADALSGAAIALSEHPLLRALAATEPAALARLGRIDPGSAGWQAARAGVDSSLAGDSRAGTEMVLRWLASFVLSPASGAEIGEDVAILIAGLPDAPAADADSVVPQEARTA